MSKQNTLENLFEIDFPSKFVALRVVLFHLPVHCTRKKMQVWREGRAADLLDFLTKWLNARRRALISAGTFKSQKRAGTGLDWIRDWARRRGKLSADQRDVSLTCCVRVPRNVQRRYWCKVVFIYLSYVCLKKNCWVKLFLLHYTL